MHAFPKSVLVTGATGGIGLAVCDRLARAGAFRLYGVAREARCKRAASAGISYEERLAEETSNVPLRKYGTPAEVAGAVEGLLSAFSDHMSGLNVLHDGGFTRSY